MKDDLPTIAQPLLPTESKETTINISGERNKVVLHADEVQNTIHVVVTGGRSGRHGERQQLYTMNTAYYNLFVVEGEMYENDIGTFQIATDLAKPVMKLPTAESFGLTEAKEERLSQIIAEINSRTGKAYDNDVAVKAMLQIKDILMKSEKLKTSTMNNTVKDFEFSYFDDIDDALIEGLSQNQDFFSLLSVK